MPALAQQRFRRWPAGDSAAAAFNQRGKFRVGLGPLPHALAGMDDGGVIPPELLPDIRQRQLRGDRGAAQVSCRHSRPRYLLGALIAVQRLSGYPKFRRDSVFYRPTLECHVHPAPCPSIGVRSCTAARPRRLPLRFQDVPQPSSAEIRSPETAARIRNAAPTAADIHGLGNAVRSATNSQYRHCIRRGAPPALRDTGLSQRKTVLQARHCRTVQAVSVVRIAYRRGG